ncbi:MAG: (Fe-S)-binding protein [Alphaproteobacteria bacterium]|nr:(Fe-S)-binding protein [Alphaproteobacteria bacterium]MDE2495941.1 (Fe-S)-binding protein [Alphaproteobacteria bacterium]
MSIPIAPVLGIFADNVRKRGSVLPLSKRKATGWARGLNLPRGGETVLYTGHMYQMVPAIHAMASQMALLENSFLTRFFGIGRLVNKFVDLSFFMGLTASSERMRHSNQVLRDIVELLRGAGVKFGYLYEDEFYAGALLYDNGQDEAFGEHARRVTARLKKLGVRRLITVDPHTTKMLRQGYPHFVKDFDIEVQNYLEVLAQRHPKPAETVSGEVVLHDSCVYARYEDICDQPRELLRAAGLSVREPKLSGKAVHCCGGPIESLFPSEAHRISGNRVDQLEAEGKNVVTMCPFCWVNLSKAAGNRLVINDIASILAASRRQASSSTASVK